MFYQCLTARTKSYTSPIHVCVFNTTAQYPTSPVVGAGSLAGLGRAGQRGLPLLLHATRLLPYRLHDVRAHLQPDLHCVTFRTWVQQQLAAKEAHQAKKTPGQAFLGFFCFARKSV